MIFTSPQAIRQTKAASKNKKASGMDAFLL
jgi:hypothetical protein